MPKPAHIRPEDYPLDKVFMTPEELGVYNPQREEFLQLTNVLHFDAEERLLIGHRRVEEGEWWARGHLPGRPLFPGVLMLEAMAQCASLHTHLGYDLPEGTFIGFGGVDSVRFRGVVHPDTDLLIAGKMISANVARRGFKWDGQVLTLDGKLVCEGVIFGFGI